MIARLLLMLLLASLSLPAMARAPCHDGSGDMAGMTMPHTSPQPSDAPDRKAVAMHACMGCIPPVTLLRVGLPVPLPIAAILPVARLVRFDRGRITPPATPPPRRDA